MNNLKYLLMKLTFFNLSLLLLTCLIIACSSDETVTPEITIEDTVDYFSEPINFPSSGGSKIIKFNCNVKWSNYSAPLLK